MSSVARRVGFGVAALALLAGAVFVSGAVATAQGADPVVVLDRTGTAAAETMLVTGQRWPETAMVIVQLCGHGGLRGTVDCDVANQRTAGVGPSGHFSVELTVALPPVPCPCVVKATDQSTQVSATAPIAVAGIPTVPLTAEDLPDPRSVEISSIHIKGGPRIAELFGAGGRRILEFTLVNTGPVAVDAPRVSIAWGRGANPDGFVEPPVTSRLEPGQTDTLTVALRRSAMTIGSQTAIVEVQGLGSPVTARAATSAYPWGLLVIALVVLQLALLWIRNRVRRRIAPNPDTPPAELAGAVLELNAAPTALASSSPSSSSFAPVAEEAVAEEATEDAAGDAAPRVIDLVEAEQVDPPPVAQPEAGLNGSTSVTGDGALSVPDPAGPSLLDDVAAARAELVELRRQAQVALDRARELAEECTQATESRVRGLEEQARLTLRAADESCTESAMAVAAVRARAEALLDDATRAADAMTTSADALRRDAAADRDAARAALEDLRRERAELLDAATEAVEEVLREVDDRAQQLADGLASGTAAPAEVAVEARRHRVPRVDDLDGRLADAISRAFASVRSDHSSAD